MRFSYSAGNMFLKCKKKWYLKYVEKVDRDTDSEDDALALREGKALHQVLELSVRDGKNFKLDFLTNAAAEYQLDEESMFKVYACLTSYYRLHARCGLTVVGTEVEIGDEGYVGYIDSIMQDSNGNWWIEDTKTTGMLMETIFARLHNDTQLNIYAYYAPQIAEKLKLPLRLFAGVRYRVVAKPRIVNKPGEPLQAYAGRTTPKIFDVEIPKRLLNPEDAYLAHMALRNEALMLTASAPCNRQSCIDYNRPCEYWSKCHSGTFTECKNSCSVFTAENISDRTLPPMKSVDLLA